MTRLKVSLKEAGETRPTSMNLTTISLAAFRSSSSRDGRGADAGRSRPMRGSLLLRFFGILVLSFEFRVSSLVVQGGQPSVSGLRLFLKIVCSEKFKVQGFKIKVESVGSAHPANSKLE